MPEQFTTCDVCNRLIRVEHGPVCVFCQPSVTGDAPVDDDEPAFTFDLPNDNDDEDEDE